MSKGYDGCTYSAYGELICPNSSLPKTHGPTGPPPYIKMNTVERYTANGQPGWVSQCEENNARMDAFSHGFPTASTEWQTKGNAIHDTQGKVDGNLQVNLSSPGCLYYAGGQVVCLQQPSIRKY